MASEAVSQQGDTPRFSIFRAADAPDFSEVDCMEPVGLTPVIMEGIERATAEGAAEGNIVKLLFSMPGMSLTYAWFKSGFPLPLHSHNADCLYYIIAGSLKLGTEELGPGDGFFVGTDVPYTYTPGPDGVEVLEFRTAHEFDIRFLGKTATYWDKTVETLRRQRAGWAGEKPPSASFAKA
ncbi:cupin domain-containing protein [Sandaracinobacteroides sp. A072]|uniref:cupin domain-containing protein n=1 Tax=Sandaracinobacteroides sp. A072 TaxID=3461146 RepID=UPI004042D16B